ncbi:superoxide dismutase [Cu-Zn] 1-like [Aricia agestis]|uniref:superoxide dismutase [Cu-Zn] 1-like n=1 Tax=Aricia agestis TaxID=91739 RepID=UPI001C207E87|nr:superoxide dismutase [Cu-Zn] 1-like [Aricia agestis]
MDVIDVDDLIVEVQKRSPIYDTSLKEYYDLSEKKKLWYQICQIIYTPAVWIKLSSTEKTKYVFKAIMAKFLIVLALAAVASAHHEREGPLKAIVRITSPTGKDVSGLIKFTQLDDSKVHVEGSISGLPAGEYGFHVHEKGDLSGGCASTGSHFNPEHKQHGHPNDENRHVGDLGNVVFDAHGNSTLDFVDSQISLYGPHCIVGRAVVLHEKADDYGKSDHPDSKKTGNAGGRVACGVIGILSPVDGWFENSALQCSLSSSILLLLVLIYSVVQY